MRRLLLLLLFVATPLWAASSTTDLYIPSVGIPQGNQNTTFIANTLRCADFVPAMGITSATQLYIRTGSSSPSADATVGVAIYNADGSSQIVEDTATYHNATTNEDILFTTPTPSSFSLTAGTMYRLCWCSSAATGSYQAAGLTTSVAEPFANAFTTHQGTGDGSHLCSSGDPPSTTGTLSAASFGVIMVKLGTATP